MTAHAAVTPHHLSAHAAISILDQGGNAVDAAVGAVAAQGVVAPETCGLGGDLFALVHTPGWAEPRALNASGRAGSGVSAAHLRESGAISIPPDHRAVVTIPGCVDGLVSLNESLGTLSLSDVLAPAVSLAQEGFEVSTEQASAFKRQASVYRDNKAVSGFYPEGRPVNKGDKVSRPDLARTLADLASGGRRAFYEGTPGGDIVEATHGLISPADLVAPQSMWVDPIGIETAGLTAWTIPPNSQGYLGPGALAVFEMLDPPADPADPLWWHLLIESYRCLAWERDDVVADPEHLSLPASLLLDGSRLHRAASTVDREQTGTWPRMGNLAGTAYLCVVDARGMAVSIIQSNYHGTGSPFGAKRSGFLLHDRGRGFGLTPGHPNELAPGKRPLHTLSPTLWTNGTTARWVVGTRGGDVQPQLIAQMAALSILGTSDLDTAQKAPRWAIADSGPGSASGLRVEPGVDKTVLADLGKRGHDIEIMDGPQPGWGPVSIIGLEGDRRIAAADPRVDTAVALVS